MAPFTFKWIMLKVNVENPVVKNQSVWIIYPIACRREMYLGTLAHRPKSSITDRLQP